MKAGHDQDHRPLRVALLSPCFWPEVRRGGERLVRELADELIAAGHSARLITSHPGARSVRVEEGLPVIRNRRLPDRWIPVAGHEDYTTHVPLSYLTLRRGEDDVAHAVYATDALAATRWSRRSGRPSVYTHLGIPDEADLAERRWRERIVRRAARDASAMTVVSRAAAAAARRTLGVEARVIYPGVDLEKFRPAPERFAEPTVICAADADQPRKRVDMLVEAMRLVRRERPGARLILSRPSERRAAEISAALPEVEFLEDHAALPEASARAWVAALPSRDEAFGLVLAEALAAGTPVVGSVHGGIPEIAADEGVGRVFSPDDASALARAIVEALEMAEDPGTAAECRRRAGEYSAQRSADAYVELYRELGAGVA
jgi:glycosyltransferase involved in cell wall biosynthesis